MGKILAIDDEISILTLCQELFKRNNHTVQTATNGQTALELLTKDQPDLIILDLNLKNENGLNLIPNIKTRSPKSAILIFSGFLDAEIEKKAFAAGASEIVSKGSSTNELVQKVEKLLQHSKNPDARKAEKILVVDDEATIRSLLTAFLNEKGYIALEAKSGQEAIEIVKAEKPDLMLLDVNMPGMSGIETLRKIREFNKEIGVVMATANQDEATAKEAAELGSYQYVLKPFDLKYLELVVMTRLLMA